MPRRPRITIICITSDRLVRADFDRPGSEPSLIVRTRPAIDDLPGLVETTIRLGTPVGKRVWVLSTDIFLQVADLASVPGTLNEDEVRRALACELEPLSNISALDSLVAYAPLSAESGHASYLVSQMPRYEAERIEEVVRRAGGQLVSITHPAGAPAPFHTAGPLDAWARIESWPDATIRISRAPGQPVTRTHLHTPFGSSASASSGQWGGNTVSSPNTELLDASGAAPAPSDPSIRSRRLDNEQDLHAILTTCSLILAEDLAPTQVITPPKPPVPAQTWAALATVCTLLVALGCAAHWWYTNRQIDTLTAEIQQRREPINEREALIKQRDAIALRIQQKQQRIDALRSDAAAAHAAFLAYQARAPEVLRSVWTAAGDLSGRMTLLSIQSNDRGLILVGDALAPSVADDFAQSLVEPLGAVGLRVDPPRTEVTSRVWSFSVPLHDEIRVPRTAQAQAEPISNTRRTRR